MLFNKNVKNASWIIGEQIFQMVLSLVVGILSARYLGPSNYGSLNYTASFVSFFSAIATLGMEGVVIKKMIANPDKEGEYLGSCILYRFISSFLSSIAILIIIAILNPGDTTKLVLAALQTIQLIFQAFYILNAWFQRYLNSKYISMAKMVACVIVYSYKVYLLVTAKSIEWFAFSNSLSYIIIGIVLYLFYKKEKGQILKINFKAGNDVLKDSYHFIISGLMVAIYGQIDKIMIGKMMTDADVGYYTTAAALCAMWIFVPNAIINSFRPTIMEYKEKNMEKEYLKKLKQLYSFLIWLCIFVSVCVFALGGIAIKILYGSPYLPASAPLKILIWSELFSVMGTARGIWILCENKNRYVKYYLCIGAVVNIVLNAVMIPLCGVEGAAFATLITQIVTCVIAPMFYKETRTHSKILMEAFCFKW